MTASELLSALQARGATVRVDGGDLVVRAPQGVLSVGMRAALAHLKPVLLAELRKTERQGPDNIDALTKFPPAPSSTHRPLPEGAGPPFSPPALTPCPMCHASRFYPVNGAWFCMACWPNPFDAAAHVARQGKQTRASSQRRRCHE